jgi:hypothetical protein
MFLTVDKVETLTRIVLWEQQLQNLVNALVEPEWSQMDVGLKPVCSVIVQLRSFGIRIELKVRPFILAKVILKCHQHRQMDQRSFSIAEKF